MNMFWQIVLGVPVGAVEILVLGWVAKRWLGVELPKVITINTDIRAEERGWTRGYAEAIESMRERP